MKYNFSLKENSSSRRQAFARSQCSFLRSEENVNLNNFNTLGVWMLVSPAIFMDTVLNGNHIVIAGVVAIALCWQML